MAGTPSESEPAASPWAIAHARELGRAGPTLPAGEVEVRLVTDPWSVWCWGFEPVRRTLEARFPSIRFTTHVGGMFARMPDPATLGFDVERFFSVVQRTTGMPLRIDATRRDRPTSTYPACVHVAAARLVQPEAEARYLRKLREAVYLDAKNVSRPDVAAEVAVACGLPREEFLEALASGEPEREFRQSLAALESQGIHAYPTFVIRVGDRAARVEGFQTLPGLLAIVENASHRQHAARPPPSPRTVVPVGERVATREVSEVLGVSVEQAFEELTALEREGHLKRERHPNGDVWARV